MNVVFATNGLSIVRMAIVCNAKGAEFVCQQRKLSQRRPTDAP